MFEYEKLMQDASKKIVVASPQIDLPILNVSFLTGKKYWYQTVFCAYSLQKVTPNPIHFTFFDDGSISEVSNIKIQVPHSTIISAEEIDSNLNQFLPLEKYPHLHHKRKVYKHIRKLTDVYTSGDGWKLMLDSDMLFWKEPKTMIDWLLNPKQPFHILDSETAYGYSFDVMEKFTKTKIYDKINVGALGLHTDMVDFDKLEYWAKTLEQNYGTSYYLEQALSAMIIGDKKCIVGNKTDFIVYPSKNQVIERQGVLQHYVDVSKKWYFEYGWKNV